MRDRLIGLITKSGQVDTWNHHTDDFKEPNPIDKLADAILADGWIKPPCKVGDKVYVGNFDTTISEIIIGTGITFMCYFDCDWVIENVGCGDCPFADWYTTYEGDIDCQAGGCFSFTEKDIGKTVFLTREETGQASKGGAE